MSYFDGMDFSEIPIVFRTCDECENLFEVRQDIAFEMGAWAEQGEPYVCPICLPDNFYCDEGIDEST